MDLKKHILSLVQISIPGVLTIHCLSMVHVLRVLVKVSSCVLAHECCAR